MTAITLECLGCVCGHADYLHIDGKKCKPTRCPCKKFTLDPERNEILSITISAITAHKFKNFVVLKHGFKKGGLSFEVERALREYMGEENLDVYINDNEWKQHNK
jgi:hypothetical protein